MKSKKTDVIRIMGLPVDQGGCGWYRIRQPFQMIQDNTPHDTHIWNREKDNGEGIAAAIPHTDIVVFRPNAEPGFFKMSSYKEMDHLRFVLDIDDNTEDISPYNFHYQGFGIHEFYDNNAQKWLWKHGENKFDINKNRDRYQNLIRALFTADMVTVTTPILQKYAKHYNDNVVILPNSINFNHYWKVDTKPNKRLRVLWSGGLSHYEDWYEIKKPLNKLMREYQFELWLVGQAFPGLIDKDLQHLVKAHGWIDFKAHPYRLACAAADLAIVPLSDLPFNKYKSSVKWYEYSALKIPSVVANLPPYNLDFTDGENAIGYKTPKDFYQAVSRLLESVSLRKKIGENAYKWVKTNRDAQKNVNMWVDAYKSLKDYGHKPSSLPINSN